MKCIITVDNVVNAMICCENYKFPSVIHTARRHFISSINNSCIVKQIANDMYLGGLKSSAIRQLLNTNCAIVEFYFVDIYSKTRKMLSGVTLEEALKIFQIMGDITQSIQKFNELPANKNSNTKQAIVVYNSPLMYINPSEILLPFAMKTNNNNTLNANEEQIQEMCGFKVFSLQFYNRQNDIFSLQICAKSNETFAKIVDCILNVLRNMMDNQYSIKVEVFIVMAIM